MHSSQSKNKFVNIPLLSPLFFNFDALIFIVILINPYYMKKILKITGIVLLSLLLLIITLPFVFKGKINELIKTEINKNVNAKVDYSGFSFSLLRSFPDFSVRLDNLQVIGINEFDGDTLLTLGSFYARLDLLSVIKMDNIDIKALSLSDMGLNVITLPNGKANWDIAKADTAAVVADTATATASPFKLQLKKFEIKDARIKYDDRVSNMQASIKGFNFLLSGDLSDKKTLLEILSGIDQISFAMDGIPYLNKASMKFKGAIDADLEHSVYLLKENEFSLNEILLAWSGSIAMPGDTMEVDVKFNTAKKEFKSLLSLIPLIYTKDFETVKTQGDLLLEGYVKGQMYDSIMPNAGIKLLVSNAMFRYPDLPRSVEKIAIDLSAFYDGKQMDNSLLDINAFHFEIGNNPMDLVLNIKTPISDPSLNAKFNGSIDFEGLRDVMPLDSIELKGKLTAALDMMGSLSMIEKEQYESFKADGFIKLNGFEFKSADLPTAFLIRNAVLNFTPKIVQLEDFDATLGNSDFKLAGELTNFIPYALSDKTLSGKLSFNSNLLDLNQFMSEEPAAAETTTTDTSAMELIELPKNIDFAMTSKISRINFDKLIISNVDGTIYLKDGKAVMEKLAMNLLEGSLLLSGEYNTQDLTKAFVDFNMDIKGFDIPASFVAFNTVQKLAPVAKNAKGKYNLAMSFRSFLDAQMSPVMSSVVGEGSFSSANVEIVNSNMFGKIADQLKNDKYRNLSLKDVAFTFQIKDGRIYLDPFDTKMGASTFNISGDQGIDQSMNYKILYAMPRSEFGGAANALLNNLSDQAASKGVNVAMADVVKINVLAGGTISDPKISLSLSEDGKTGVKDMVKDQVKKVVEEKKAEVKAKVKEEAEKLIAKAQKEADEVKAAAAKAAEITRKEANANADRLEKEASGKPKLLKDAAKKSADKIRSEGDKKANQIIQEGNQKADLIMQKARAEADKL